MEQWIRFFLGTPRRLLTTLAVLALVVVIFVPGILALVVAQLIAAVAPLLGPALACGVYVLFTHDHRDAVRCNRGAVEQSAADHATVIIQLLGAAPA